MPAGYPMAPRAHTVTAANVSIEHFGASADYQTLFTEFGFTAEHVVAAARRSLATTS